MDDKAALTSTARERLSRSDYAYCEPDDGPCHYPIHDAAHVRNALARAAQQMKAGGKGAEIARKAMPKIQAMAKRMGIGEPAKATLLDDDSFRLLAIPFGGPIPSPLSPRGVDLDGEWFSERTDIKADWLTERIVDWHHGGDALMGRTPIGKAIDPVMDDDGWWVTVWAKHGERRLELIKRLAEQQPIFGSSESIAGMTKKASTGEILVWPYWRQTLSTSPQNTKSILRPLKASVDDAYANGVTPTAAFWADLAADLDALQSDLRHSSLAGDDAAKAGRVLSAVNEAALRKSIEELFAVLAKLEKPA